jgi:predicted aspartyl protease
MVVRGPLVQVTLGLHPQDAAATQAAGGIPKTFVHHLLVDTGAQRTCVEDKIAQALGLVPIHFAQMMGVSGKVEDYPVYRMSITLGMKEDGTEKVLPATFVSDVVGTPSPATPLTHVGLLGRDFLRYVKVVYDGPEATFELVDYKHVSARHVGPQKPPLGKGWKGIESARKRSRKQKRRR